MMIWCPVKLIEERLSLQPELNWILVISCRASTWQVPISTNVAFKKLISFPGMATLAPLVLLLSPPSFVCLAYQVIESLYS